jgi:hypothetical protein
MEILVLFAIAALLLFGPRRGGRAPGAFAIVLGMAFLLWFAIALGLGWVWRAIVGSIGQP